MKTCMPHRLAGAGLLLIAALPVRGTEPGKLMKMTTTMRMQMPGMPAMSPMAHTMTVCSPVRLTDPKQLLQRQQACTVSNVRQSGQTLSYHMECPGEASMSGDGSFRIAANGDVHGSFHMVGTREGQSMVMDSTIDGERIGACDYTPPASPP